MNRKVLESDQPRIRSSPYGIFVNQAGYPPQGRKTAVMPFQAEAFTVTDLSGNVRFEAPVHFHGWDEASGDNVSTADFSDFTVPGAYRVQAGGKSSAVFRIGEDVYDQVFHDVAKAFYFLRCGCRLEEPYAGVYRHDVCHHTSAVLWSDRSVSLDVSGGWHDAGDYGRYVTPGACAAAHLLYAYKMFPEAFDALRLNIPETGMPDILSEVRYELEWLLKMQRPDGGVYHKVTTQRHAPFVMPEDDRAQLFVFDVSSMATADFAAVAALASGMYRAYDEAFADRLFAAAQRSLHWLDNHPAFIGFTNPEGCNTGGYGQRDDASNRYWAYAEMHALTGEERYARRMTEFIEQGVSLTSLGYGDLGGLGSLAYLLCDQKKHGDTEALLRKAFRDKALELRDVSDRCGYGVAMKPREYGWGSNMTVMKNGMIFAISGLLNGDDFAKEYAGKQLDYLLGVNALGISYVTGTGDFRCNDPHLRPAYADGIPACMPGMIAGGPNGRPADPRAKEIIPAGTPPMKCYADDAACYSLNEITIYWNSPAVFVLGYLLRERGK